MSADPKPAGPVLSGPSVPRFAPGVRLREDRVRGGWVLLAPERLLQPDEAATAILRLVDGQRDIDSIVEALARDYAAPRAEIDGDVRALLAGLVARGVLAA